MKLDRVPIALGAVFCAALAFFVLQSAPAPEPSARMAFAEALARAIAQERRIVFPLGVAASGRLISPQRRECQRARTRS